MPPKTKPSSADWENQKEAIRRLYLGQDLTLQVVRKQLEDDGFTATKAQYEAKFKEWGFSKNVPVNIWKHVGFKIGKRKREGKDSAVSINGIEIPIKRVKKEISRHYYSVIERAEFEKLNAPSPPGSLAVISTPPSQQEVLIIERWPSNLPWFSFIRFLDTRLEGLPRMQLNPQTFQGGLPFTQKKSQENDNLVEQSPTEISGGRQFIFDTIKEYASSGLNHALLPFSSDVEWPAEIDSSMSIESTTSNHWGLKMLIYLASNKLLESSDIDVIWRMIDDTGIKQLANFSDSSVWKHTSLEAAMECLFQTGIRKGHESLVRWLLDSGMEPNTKLKLESAEIEAHLPLIVALSASWSASGMLKLLLSKGSSPVLICCERHGSPIQFLIGNRIELNDDIYPPGYCSPYPQIRQVFWDVFSKIMETLNQHPKSQPLRYGDQFNVDFSALWVDSIEEDSDIDQEKDNKVQDIYRLIELVETVATRISNPGASVITPTVLIRAAEKYDEGLIKFMHKHGQKMDCCHGHGRFPLLAALEFLEFEDYNDDAEIYISNVKLLLELGASADYIPSSQVHAGCSPALSAAVHVADDGFGPSEAVELLVRHGAHAQGLPNCGEEGHLSLLDCVRSQEKWWPQAFTRVLISLHHAGLPLPEWSLISVLELAYRNGEYESEDTLPTMFEKLFETSPDICSNSFLRSRRGWTALQYAVNMDEQRLAQILVQHGAKHMSKRAYLDLLTGDFSTEAVEDIVSKLRKNGKVEQSRDLMFRRLIEILRTYQDGEVFSDLLRQYCKMPRSSEQEAYVMHKACNSGQENLITIAMEMLPNTYSSDALGTLVSSQKLDAENQRIFIHKLLGRRSGARLDLPTETQMFISIIDEALRAGGDGTILEWLVTHNEKGSKNACPHSSKFALKFFTRISIKIRHVDEFVTPWLDHGLTASPYFGIMIACTSPAEKMGVLLDHGFQSNRRLRWSLTVLQIAVARGDRAMTLRLLKAGCNVNARPPWRDIPKSIHKRLQDDILKVLTSHNEQTRRRTALQLAAEEGNTLFVKMLLDFGANVNGQPARVGGATALQIACIKGYIEIARLLISKGADVNAPGAEYFGRTALEGAAENGRLDIVGLLFEHGCRVDGCFRREYIRAVGFAQAQGNHALTKFLQDFGEWTKADDDSLKEVDLKDEEPGSRDLEEDLQEDEDVSEVDEYEDYYDYDEFYESCEDNEDDEEDEDEEEDEDDEEYEDDEDASEVDTAEIEYDAEALFPYEPGIQSDSADHSTLSQAWNTTSSVSYASLEATNSSDRPGQLLRSGETEYTDWDKLIGIYASQEEPL